MQDARDKDTTPSARAQLARAWQVLEEQKRDMRKIPKVKPVDAVARKSPKPIPPPTLEP